MYTNRKWLVFPKREGWAGVPGAQAAEMGAGARSPAGWAARILEKPSRETLSL